MSKHAMVPCIVCGKILENVEMDAENQPYAGLAFTSDGHYGGTVFDPMDGSYLEVNICDPCLIEAQRAGKVLWGKSAQPVLSGRGVVGWQKVNRQLVLWNGNAEADFKIDVLRVDEEDIGSDLYPEIKWNGDPSNKK